MKPNTLQKKVARMIQAQASFWEGTNDIKSPTHYSDLDADIDNIEELSEEQNKELNQLMSNLFAFVKKIG